MPVEARSHYTQGADNLQPIMVPVNASSEDAFVALLRYAASPVTALSGSTWQAVRLDDEQALILTLKEGPLAYMRLRIAAEPVEPPNEMATVLWITAEYAPRPSRLNGALERWRAHRDATSLRTEVLSVLNQLEPVARPDAGRMARTSERLHVRAPARLYVGPRTWRAEVLNVSEGGLSMIIYSHPSAVEGDMRFLLETASGEVEVLPHREHNRAPVTVRHAVPSKGGVQVGLEVLDREATRILLRRAKGPAPTAPPVP